MALSGRSREKADSRTFACSFEVRIAWLLDGIHPQHLALPANCVRQQRSGRCFDEKECANGPKSAFWQQVDQCRTRS
ncbi:MAG: hypothetical protein ACI8W7_000788 [Gammaproteobacteria bacterium]|jgi:hypothetical protein